MINVVGKRSVKRIGDAYAVTKKPRGLAVKSQDVVAFVSMQAIPQDGTFAPTYVEKPFAELGSSNNYFEKGDILVAKITPCFENGKQAFTDAFPFPFGYATTEVIPLHPIRTHEDDPRFLFYFLLHPSVRSSVAERMEGSTARQRVPEEVLLDVKYPAFPIHEQEQIAEALQRLRNAISLEVACENACVKIKRATISRLYAHGLRDDAQKESEIGLIPKNWDVTTLGAQCSVISKGSSPKWQGFNYVSSGVLFVRSQNVGDGTLELRDTVYLPEAWNEKEPRSILHSGDILINLVGASIGRVALGTDEVERANCNQAVCFARPLPQALLGKFVVGFLLTDAGQDQIHQQKKDIARANLSLEDVRGLLVPKPSIAEQAEIISVLESLDQRIDIHRRKKALLEDLFHALLDGLMTGNVRVSELNQTDSHTSMEFERTTL